MATPLERMDGKYEILEKMREGGMGAVYKVRHRLLDEIRVIKMMRQHLAHDEVLRTRFLREAKLAIRMHHPNLAQLYDFTMDDEGNAFIVMEFIEGTTLQELLRAAGPLSIGLALEIAAQTLRVLAYLHRKEVIHRDISPDNLMLSQDDEGHPLVKLIDLGIAKVADPTGGLTATGTFLGKVRYSSPEQLRSQDGAEFDARTDLYSFGIVLYELLTAHYPISGSTTSALIAGHLLNPPLDFDVADPEGRVPDDLRQAVLKTLEKDPDGRYLTAEALRHALAAIQKRYPLDDAEVRELYDAPRRPTQRLNVPRPGSTQDHLDRQFLLAATPPPSSNGASSPPGSTAEAPAAPATPTAAVQRQIKALLFGAQKLVELHHYDEARLQLATVLELDPENREARSLVKAVDAADQKLRARREEAAAEIAAALEDGQLELARERLGVAVERLGESDLFEDLSSRLEAAEQAALERESKRQALLEEGRRLVDGKDWATALDRLAEAQALGPDDPEVVALLERAQEGHARELEAKRRRQEVDRTAASIAAQLLAQHLEEAERALTLARKLYGDEPAFRPLGARLEELRTAWNHERAAELHAEARRLSAEASFVEAFESLAEARRLAPELSETDALEKEIRAALAHHEETVRRARALEAVLTGVDRLLDAGRLATAAARLGEAEGELGRDPTLDERKDRLEAALGDRTRREGELFEALERARELAANGEIEGALEAIEVAQAAAVEEPELAGPVDEAEGAIRQRIEEHRIDLSVAEAAESIAGHLTGNDLEGAEHELALAERLYGPRESFAGLRTRLDELRQQERRAKVEGLLARAFGERASFSDVTAALEEALAIDPENAKVRRLLAETREAMVRHRHEQRASAWAAVLPGIDSMVAEGQLKKALAELKRSLDKLGPIPEAAAFRIRLERLLTRS